MPIAETEKPFRGIYGRLKTRHKKAADKGGDKKPPFNRGALVLKVVSEGQE